MAAVLLLAAGLRLYFVCTAMVYHPIRGDAIQYHAYAWNLVHHLTFSHQAASPSVPMPDSYRDPGYPAFLAFWMSWLGDGSAWYVAILLSQALLSAATVGLGFLIARRCLPFGWALAAGALTAVWPHLITSSSYLLTETLAGFLLTLGVLLATSRHRAPLIAGAVALSLAGLTNAVLLPVGAGLALVLRARGHLTTKAAALFLVASLALPAAWSIRNVSLPPQATSSTNRALQNLVQGSWPLYHPAYRAMINGSAQGRAILDDIDAEYHTMARDFPAGWSQMMDRMGQHPWRYVWWYIAQKPTEFWGWNIQIGQGDIYVYPTMNSPFRNHPTWRALEAITRALNPWLAALLLIGTILVAIKRQAGATRAGSSALDATAAVLLYATVVYSLLQAEPRYAIPFRALQMVVCMVALRAVTLGVAKARQRNAAKQAAQ
ncbi:glycosyltransferase family 39 protein [Oleiagrimonas sp. C23AA]|uniref:glycosyltransferase family 39 protein n=1 Tax=Oleiagrimonas sp. C23AA TaxID=2719047 RepID=UPI00141DABE9|nr:glycosyltransferase family 39 protein [Oleiagrimonas sp. C23AA]NII11446.1 glycosyltransferase family 39 protein [Oleiagrimonas sp. C23AA]